MLNNYECVPRYTRSFPHINAQNWNVIAKVDGSSHKGGYLLPNVALMF